MRSIAETISDLSVPSRPGEWSSHAAMNCYMCIIMKRYRRYNGTESYLDQFCWANREKKGNTFLSVAKRTVLRLWPPENDLEEIRN